MGKNIHSISRLLWEHPRPELWNEPPLDSLDPQSPNPFMASPSPDPIQRLAIKGFRDWGSRLSSGGSFRSPGWGRSRSSLEIDWIFFCHFNFPESAVIYFLWTLPLELTYLVFWEQLVLCTVLRRRKNHFKNQNSCFFFQNQEALVCKPLFPHVSNAFSQQPLSYWQKCYSLNLSETRTLIRCNSVHSLV